MDPGNLSDPEPLPGARRRPAAPALVGLVTAPGAGQTLAGAEEVLARFGLTTVRREIASLAEAEGFAREIAPAGGPPGPRAVIVGSADASLPAALARSSAGLPVIRVPVHAAAGDDAGAAALRLLWPEPPPTSDAADAGEGAFATVAIGEAGAKNAALLVIAILALTDGGLREALRAFRREQTAAVLAGGLPVGEDAAAP